MGLSSLFLQSNQKRWPQNFSVLFTSALLLILTWTFFSMDPTTSLLLNSGSAPTTFSSVKSFILEENFELFISRVVRDHISPALMILLYFGPSALRKMWAKIL